MSGLVGNPEDLLSHNEAHFKPLASVSFTVIALKNISVIVSQTLNSKQTTLSVGIDVAPPNGAA